LICCTFQPMVALINHLLTYLLIYCVSVELQDCQPWLHWLPTYCISGGIQWHILCVSVCFM